LIGVINENIKEISLVCSRHLFRFHAAASG
jgi:hypothetical protein